jgi:hypothetical protein
MLDQESILYLKVRKGSGNPDSARAKCWFVGLAVLVLSEAIT